MRRPLLIPVLLAAAALAGCKDSTPPKPGPAANIQAVSSTTISAVVGTMVSSPLVVHVTDAKGLSVPGVSVSFAAPSGNTLAPPSAVTDDNGQAETQLTLTTTAGGPFQVSAMAAGVGTPAQFSVTATPGPAARVAVSTHAASVPTALDTVRLGASVQDQYGNAIANPTITWTSRDQSSLTVDGTGLVHVVKRGGAVYVVASAGTASDSAAVTAPPSPCGSTAVTSVNAGQVITDVAASGVCLRGGASAGEYALIPFFGSPTANAQVGLEVTAHGIGAPPAASIVAAARNLRNVISLRTLLAGGRAVLMRGRRHPDWSFERRLREEERTELAPRMALARQSRRVSRLDRALSPGARSMSLQAGDLVTLNANTQDACGTPTPTIARVAAISDKAIVLVDTTSPAGGFTDAEFQAYAVTFDTLVYPLDVPTFGEPSDIDGNGHTIIFFTPAVNALSPRGESSVIYGFFYPRDLLPVSACAGSNEGEMFYVMVPDTGGTINGNQFTKGFVDSVVVSTLAHEFQHLINASRRTYVNNATTGEEVWLNEGLSHIAEELLFYRESGLPSRTNIGTQLLTQQQLDLFLLYQVNNFIRYEQFLDNDASSSPYSTDDLSLPMRGAIWSFLRYMADRTRSSDGDFWYRLVNTTLAGRANLEQALSVNDDDLTGLFRDWSVSVFADDVTPGVDGRFSQASWNDRGIYSLWYSPPVPFPLATVSLADGVAAHGTLDGGGSIPIRFTVPAYQDALITVTSGGAAPPAGVMLSVVRVH